MRNQRVPSIRGRGTQLALFLHHIQPREWGGRWWITVDDEDASAAKTWEVARAVLRYLEANPEAKDTLEGIAQWWLWLELTDPVLKDLKQAVALLVSKGIILETRREGTPTYYRLNPQRHRAIYKILNRL